MHVKSFLTVLIFVASVFIAGCAQKHNQALEYNYDYPSNIGIAQLYDFDGHTTIQWRSQTHPLPHIQQMNGKTIAYQKIGESLILNGIYEQFVIESQGKDFLIKRHKKAEQIDNQTGLLLAQPIINASAQSHQELTLLENKPTEKDVNDYLTLQKEIDELKQQINHLQRQATFVNSTQRQTDKKTKQRRKNKKRSFKHILKAPAYTNAKEQK